MAAENTEPKSVLIIQIGLAAVVFLVASRFALLSYFNVQMDGEYQVKVASHKSEQLMKLRQSEQAMLAGGSGAMPIDKAIAMMATKSRESLGDTMMPKPSTDMAAVVGWGQNPTGATVPSAAPAMAVGDAGTNALTDSGATALVAGDAGAAVTASKVDGGAAPKADAGPFKSPAPVPSAPVAPKATP